MREEAGLIGALLSLTLLFVFWRDFRSRRHIPSRRSILGMAAIAAVLAVTFTVIWADGYDAPAAVIAFTAWIWLVWLGWKLFGLRQRNGS